MNGPSITCPSCGGSRDSLATPFCGGCMSTLGTVPGTDEDDDSVAAHEYRYDGPR